MTQDKLIEYRNKAIQFYQFTVMMESGEVDVKFCIENMKNASRSMIKSLDRDINEKLKNNQLININEKYVSLFEPIEVKNETLSKIREYLENSKINSNIDNKRVK